MGSLGFRLLLVATATIAATPTPNATPPPQIYRVVSRPLCSELRQRIKPAIGMIMQNDATIRKSPDLFKQYNTASLDGSDPGGAQSGPGAMDPGGSSNGTQEMALLGLENLIRPIANNIIAIQTVLDSPELRTTTGLADDDKRLQEIREKLLKALAAQNASLDIISGFVDTQQMANLQHAGEAYIGELNQPETQGASSSTPAPDPLTYNPNFAGLPPNPYTIDLATVPGLTLGYNPVTRLIEALRWTIDQTAGRENDAATAVMSSAALCAAVPLASPSP
ncbi:MAG TPA: hypothetical protein VNU22_10565 [Candidatus Acidoferrum sp.]|jgi:hypothetical protein|nr:hypothetical protein [Candidatus Acidoferrum sp.]